MVVEDVDVVVVEDVVTLGGSDVSGTEEVVDVFVLLAVVVVSGSVEDATVAGTAEAGIVTV